MPLSTTPERDLEGSVGRTQGSGMQHKAGRGSWGTATASSMPRGFLGTPGAGLWPWGSGSQAEKPGCVPGDEQQPLSHSAGHPTLWKLSLGVSRAAGPSWGRSQQLLPPKGCFPALLVAVLPRCCWGDPSECLVSAVCSSQSSVCSVPAASEPPKLLQTPPPALRGVRLPLTSLFLRFFLLDNIDIVSGARKWLHPCTHLGSWSWCVARLGLPLSSWLRMIPHPRGMQELQPPAPGRAAAPMDPLGKPTATCFSSTAPFPVLPPCP